ncbi:hypothetical protein TSAR_008432 [Trichomalopsis sarcophagae]|uniref:Uncharacterized protein n=1 Tax=Trichomalopsis sarcophagae TaxID=543379 RepID=A0A232EET9_9HYME|nr:hypothetical protein TSAR_008432 [Trichomalopsis sarcophagae]
MSRSLNKSEKNYFAPPIPLCNKCILPSLVRNESVSEVEIATEAENNDKTPGESEVEEVMKGIRGPVNKVRPKTKKYSTKCVIKSPLKDLSSSSSEEEFNTSRPDKSGPSSTVKEWMLEYTKSQACPIHTKSPLKTLKASSTA